MIKAAKGLVAAPSFNIGAALLRFLLFREHPFLSALSFPLLTIRGISPALCGPCPLFLYPCPSNFSGTLSNGAD